MKKWAIGCGVALLVVIVVAGVAGYWFIYRPAQSYIASFKQLGEIPEIEKQVSNKSTFQAPDSGELTEDMVTRFVKVQETMETRLGTKFTDLKAKYDLLAKEQKAEHREASFTEGLTALKDLAGLFVDAKRAQVEALNQAGFSLSEYDWVRKQVYAAAGMVFAEFNLRQMADAAKAGGGTLDFEKPAETEHEVPEVNKELVKPYEKKLHDWMALGFFGL